ncbi:hypothetical protein DF185_16325 [Marinifilum breve]|uniref:Type IX secretion system membrane protein PorP/SprF n=1 Tax=Marinifilum breve TaxID=2184082 RepID=A0A2V3ZV52_9BACT|nr:PorP/SprF family type IX secretion system membrane protein [Marinifilum breve]PXX98937.1 hypothetical protein DF185_16325 [Marinifilum breve]
MRQRKRWVFCFFGLILMVHSLNAQNQLGIAQYMYHHPILNPAAMTSYQDVNAFLLVRQQWVGMKGAPKVNVLNVTLPHGQNAMGVTALQESIGVHKKFRSYISYAYRLKLDRKHQYLNFGLSAGATIFGSSYNNVETREKNDPQFMYNLGGKVRPDFQLGMYYFTKKLYVGISMPSLLQNEVKFSNGKTAVSTDFDLNYLHVYLQAGYQYKINREWIWNISSLVKYVRSVPIEWDINTQFVYKNSIGGGFSFRTEKEYLVFANYQINTQLKMAYAYQHTLLGGQRFSSHEIGLAYSFIPQRKKRIIIQSPRF